MRLPEAPVLALGGGVHEARRAGGICKPGKGSRREGDSSQDQEQHRPLTLGFCPFQTSEL